MGRRKRHRREGPERRKVRDTKEEKSGEGRKRSQKEGRCEEGG